MKAQDVKAAAEQAGERPRARSAEDAGDHDADGPEVELVSKPLDPHRRTPHRKEKPEDHDDRNVARAAYAEQPVAEGRDEDADQPAGRDQTELLEELGDQQAHIHALSLAAFAGAGVVLAVAPSYRRPHALVPPSRAVPPRTARRCGGLGGVFVWVEHHAEAARRALHAHVPM